MAGILFFRIVVDIYTVCYINPKAYNMLLKLPHFFRVKYTEKDLQQKGIRVEDVSGKREHYVWRILQL